MPVLPRAVRQCLHRLARGLAALALPVAAGGWVFSGQAQADSITWVVVDRAPVMILQEGRVPASAAELGAGSADQGLAAVIRRLPQYRHEFTLSNVARIWLDMERGRNLCYFAALKTPARLAVATFTPARLVPPQAVLVRKARRQALVGSATRVSLAELVARAGAEGRVEKGRSYGPELDALLAARPLASESVPNTGALLKPLARGHFSFTIEYPQTLHYMVQHGQIPDALDLIDIQEAGSWSESYVACTRNAWGQKVIQDIDRAIREASAGRAYRSAVMAWTPPALLQAKRAEVQRFFDERSRGGPRIE